MTEILQPLGPPPSARLAADICDVDLTDGATFAVGRAPPVFDALRAAGGVTWHTEAAGAAPHR